MKMRILGTLAGVLCLVLLVYPPVLKAVLIFIFSENLGAIYPLQEPWRLVTDHFLMVAATSAIAGTAGILAGLWAYFSRSAGLRRLILFSGTFLQTMPPAAVLALLVPLLGFGNLPVFWALVIFGILPVLHSTFGALNTIPSDILEAARGMGLSPLQVFLKVQLPLAWNGILSGLRTSVLINIGTAAIGATMGAGGLGRPILAGITQFQYSYLFQGAITSALLALVSDSLLGLFVRYKRGNLPADRRLFEGKDI